MAPLPVGTCPPKRVPSWTYISLVLSLDLATPFPSISQSGIFQAFVLESYNKSRTSLCVMEHRPHSAPPTAYLHGVHLPRSRRDTYESDSEDGFPAVPSNLVMQRTSSDECRRNTVCDSRCTQTHYPFPCAGSSTTPQFPSLEFPENRPEHIVASSSPCVSHEGFAPEPSSRKYVVYTETCAIVSDQLGPQKNPDLPPNWKLFVRLDGSLYFYDPAKRLVTKENMYRAGIRHRVERKAQDLFRKLTSSRTLMPLDWELCIEFFDHKDELDHHYISHEHGFLFRLGPDASKASHMERVRYWEHVERYCMHLKLVPPFTEAELLSELAYGATERILENKETMFQFSDLQGRRLLETYRELKEAQSSGCNVVPALTGLFARVMKLVEENRIRCKYGTFDARPYRPCSVPEPTTWIKVLDVFLIFIFFGTHRMYRTRLQSTRIKNIVYLPDFRELLRSFLLEWGDTTLLATVFVSANVAFLAVPGLNGLQRTASLCSSLFGMISIVAGVHAVWNHRSKAEASQEEAAQYMEYTEGLGDQLGHTLLACFLCLPIASLLWSVLTFTFAVAMYCITASDIRERIVLYFLLGVSGFLGLTTTSFFWFIWIGSPFQRTSFRARKNVAGGGLLYGRLREQFRTTVVGRHHGGYAV
ncbi:unnamed protein product [Somion occarium]|uniref:WW domain-containing protein n=1 Tax=Somion occarium TaxID=3059160 RepID=A0ABP1CW48_9APHY